MYPYGQVLILLKLQAYWSQHSVADEKQLTYSIAAIILINQGRVKSPEKSLVCWANAALPYRLLIPAKSNKYISESKFKFDFSKQVYYKFYNCKNLLGLQVYYNEILIYFFKE